MIEVARIALVTLVLAGALGAPVLALYLSGLRR